MTNYTIQVTLKTFHGSFGSSVERFEFSFCAESRDEAIALASANVKSQGRLYDEKSFRVIDAIPMTTALVPYDPRFHKFGWATVADAAHDCLMNELRALGRSQEAFRKAIREVAAISDAA